MSCKCIYQSGKKAGQECGNKVKTHGRCGIHQKTCVLNALKPKEQTLPRRASPQRPMISLKEKRAEYQRKQLQTKRPIKKSPTKRSPTKQSPTKRSPTKRSPIKQSPIKQSPIKQSPTKRSPIKQSPTKRSPIKRSPIKQSPTKRSPIKQSPIKRSPIKRSLSPKNSITHSSHSIRKDQKYRADDVISLLTKITIPNLLIVPTKTISEINKLIASGELTQNALYSNKISKPFKTYLEYALGYLDVQYKPIPNIKRNQIKDTILKLTNPYDITYKKLATIYKTLFGVEYVSRRNLALRYYTTFLLGEYFKFLETNKDCIHCLE